MKTVEVYTRKGCHLCEVAVSEIEKIRSAHPFDLKMTNIDENPEKIAQYGNDIPIILVDEREVCRHRLDSRALVDRLTGG